MIAPRGPQIPVYGMQAKIVAKMIALHNRAGDNGGNIGAYVSGLQESEDRIDIVRDTWLEQMKDTERLLSAFEAAQAAAVPATSNA
ncbi:hypothetical protein J1902_15160 [Arthrobacter sp. PO-11]|uniref:Uncharacterized protein n=2 Tax=Arthrobacter cavernae TaxID=2817681 RepID=A0A939HG47_9MICC|nr:hypothetical protein [Arthrobacter cavernae]